MRFTDLFTKEKLKSIYTHQIHLKGDYLELQFDIYESRLSSILKRYKNIFLIITSEYLFTTS